MNVSIEWYGLLDPQRRVGLVRVHPEGGYGSPWTFSCVWHDDGTDVLKVELAMRAPTIPELRAMVREAKSLGFKRTQWERRNVNNERTADVRL